MEEKETGLPGESLSTQKRLSSGQDPGWNDPPKWAFTGSQNPTGTPGKRTLNKRVPFPLTSTQTPDARNEPGPKIGMMPPTLEASPSLTTAPHPPLMLPSDREGGEKAEEPCVDKERALEETLANLSSVIEEVTEGHKAEEIRKRIDSMRAAWAEDKLNSAVHSRVLELSKALANKDVQRADEIHLQLVMRYGSLCAAWIPGIRHIVLALKSKSGGPEHAAEPQRCPFPVRETD